MYLEPSEWVWWINGGWYVRYAFSMLTTSRTVYDSFSDEKSISLIPLSEIKEMFCLVKFRFNARPRAVDDPIIKTCGTLSFLRSMLPKTRANSERKCLLSIHFLGLLGRDWKYWKLGFVENGPACGILDAENGFASAGNMLEELKCDFNSWVISMVLKLQKQNNEMQKWKIINVVCSGIGSICL